MLYETEPNGHKFSVGDEAFMKKVFKEYFNWLSDYRLYKKHK